ncbi:hypothetical protein PFLmoz3_06156 [Pseudomonas fluorescens]|uniref:Uncharacterized protein n=1 Tax=Pseudomonas fluorescens TaxID=294 RepID=A0A120FZ00_PSEFL|nr:hypothetical protein PFLmoz3_06156 [Pseudomonas fluorescens]
MPEYTVASHSTITISTYGIARHWRVRPSHHNATRLARAINNGTIRISSL